MKEVGELKVEQKRGYREEDEGEITLRVDNRELKAKHNKNRIK